MRAAAEHKDFQSVLLGAKLKGEMKAAVRAIEQFNVAGVVPGTDPKLKGEVVIYTAHWDHLGNQGSGGDTIYNGAASPLWPMEKTAANLNLDSLNFVGAAKDIGTNGSERTELGAIAAATAKAMGLSVTPAAPDLGGVYFRSDHFSFAKAGVPAFSISGGRDYVKDLEAGKAKQKSYAARYHQVSDEYDPGWDLSGMVQQAQFTLNLGRMVADAPRMPAWKAGDPFAKARSAAK